MKERVSSRIFKIGSIVFFGFYCLTLIVPMIWGFMTSLKGRLDYIFNPVGLPEVWKFDNYVTAFNYMSVTYATADGGVARVFIPQMFLNTVLYSVGSTLIALICTAMAAYVLAKFRNRFTKALFTIYIATLIIPIIGSLPSMMKTMIDLGLRGNLLGVYIYHSGGFGAHLMIYYAVFKGVSWGYAEAAIVDGASHYKIFWSIMLPLTKTTFFALFVGIFIGMWNDYMTPMLYLPTMPTLAYGIYLYQFSVETDVSSLPMQIAGCMLVSLPMIILFQLMKNKLIGNLTVGGLKG